MALVAAVLVAIPGEAALAGACRMDAIGALPVEIINQRATTMVKLNGHDTRIILDSGGFFNVMSRATADQLGLRIGEAPYQMVAGHTGSNVEKHATILGVGGSADVGSTIVRDFGILGTTVHNAMFLVGGTDMGMPIVGANFLDAFDLELDLAQGELKQFKTTGCGNTALAYWAKGGPYQMADIHRDGAGMKSYVTVVINGHPVRALIDTGAPATVLSRHAAERSGIDLASSKARPGESAGGFGAKSYRTWIVPIDKFQVGSETIQHSQMVVVDSDIIPGDNENDMLLGLDFVLAHHMYIANDQAKIYFTYNGGRVFALAEPPPASSASSTAAVAAVDAGAAPKSAPEFVLRGEALLARGEYQAAIADLDAAIRLEPGKAGYYLLRAQARERSGADNADDLDKALALEPGNVEALLWRARLRMEHKNVDAAHADLATARKLAPEGSGAALMIARFDMSADQPAQALPIYDAWIRLHPADAELGMMLNNRCWARGLANRNLDGALADCRQAIALDGAKAAYLDSMGLVLLRLGRTDQAIATYDKGLSGAPHMAWSLFGRGLAEKRAGKLAASTADINSARAIFPQIDAQAAKFGLATS